MTVQRLLAKLSGTGAIQAGSRRARGGLDPRALLVLAGIGCAAAGCVPVPVYDSKTDEMLTSLQKGTDTFIAHLKETYDATPRIGKACAYPANVKTYRQFEIDVGLLQTRAAALYDDAATQSALVNLKDTFGRLEDAHKKADERADHCILPDLLPADQQAMDSAIGSLLKLELAKKGSS